ncbi:MAG: DUF4266 domain-containing protein [Epsilonproteobacteria bacterium]|nr:hypothetical protein [Campylobacterota bacterium]NPA57319.1 DUF4266 domain-containing protein [Campylobacterota bacterium]
MRGVLILFALLFSGCKALHVKPWEKEIFAREIFQQGACSDRFVEAQHHIYFSKEGSKGGEGVAGGGCGCN